LRSGQAIKSVQERNAQLMQSGVGKLHLGLDAGQPHDAAAGSVRFEVIKQRCLADPGLAPQDEHLTLSPARTCEQSVEHRALAPPAEQDIDPTMPATHRATGFLRSSVTAGKRHQVLHKNSGQLRVAWREGSTTTRRRSWRGKASIRTAPTGRARCAARRLAVSLRQSRRDTW
jgi:hypothetical protein